MIIENNILKLAEDQTVDIELSENIDLDISIAVSDGDLTTIKNLLLTVEAVNDSPNFSSASFTIFEDGQVIDIFTSAIDTLSLVIELENLGSDPDDTDLIYSIPENGQPENGIINDLNILDSLIEYTPNQDYNGDDLFSYQVCDDDGLCQIKEITVYIEPVNDAPTSESFEINVSSLSGQFFDLSEYVADIDNNLIDINVHPKKTEIKFKNEMQIQHAIKKSISQSLKNTIKVIPSMFAPRENFNNQVLDLPFNNNISNDILFLSKTILQTSACPVFPVHISSYVGFFVF